MIFFYHTLQAMEHIFILAFHIRGSFPIEENQIKCKEKNDFFHSFNYFFLIH